MSLVDDCRNHKDTRKTSMKPFWWVYCELWTDFTHCSDVYIVDVEQENAGWVSDCWICN